MLLSHQAKRTVVAFGAGLALLCALPLDAPAQSDTEQSNQDKQAANSPDGNSSDNADNDSKAGADQAAEESADGSYTWKQSYGVGLEYGQFYTGLDRWNDYLLSPNGEETFDGAPLHSFELAGEISPFEGARFTAFAGLETPIGSSPSILSVYGGLEPAFVFRRGPWALGFGVAVSAGTVQLDAGSNSFSAGLVTLRPNVELRRYFSESLAGYANIGFKQWLPFNADTSDLTIQRPLAPGGGSVQDLYEGSFHASVGVRFGHYPEHVAQIPDSDGDGLRDDVDECPNDPEDKDGFEDNDGCPDPDNDEDGIPDTEDECPNEPETENGWKDEDGCPDGDGDPDDDGIRGDEDECPEKPEDKDGFEDNDGCPDPDNDGDGLTDSDDNCPDEAGIELASGCPSDRLEISGSKLKLDETISFEDASSETLTDESRTLLGHVAQTLQVHPEFRSIRIDLFAADATSDELAERRAQAILDMMVSAGVDAKRLTIERPDRKPDASPLAGGTSASPDRTSALVIVTVTQKSSS